MEEHPLAARLICPDCGFPLEPLAESGDGTCPGCARAIRRSKGIWELLPVRTRYPWETIEQRDLGQFDRVLEESLEVFTGAMEVISNWSLTKINEVNFRRCRKLAEGKTVLEVGCGGGALVRKLAPLAAAVAAMDFSSSALATAQRLGNLGPDVLVLQANAYALPFSDESFDLVIASEVLEHLPGLELAMRQIRRVLKAGGHVVASVPNAMMFLYPLPLLVQIRRKTGRQWLAALLRREVDDTPGFYSRPFLPLAFRRLFRDHGFRVLSHTTAMLYFWRWPYDKLILWADRRWRVTETLLRLVIRGSDFLLDNRFPILRWWGTRQFIVAQKVVPDGRATSGAAAGMPAPRNAAGRG